MKVSTQKPTHSFHWWVSKLILEPGGKQISCVWSRQREILKLETKNLEKKFILDQSKPVLVISNYFVLKRHLNPQTFHVEMANFKLNLDNFEFKKFLNEKFVKIDTSPFWIQLTSIFLEKKFNWKLSNQIVCFWLNHVFDMLACHQNYILSAEYLYFDKTVFLNRGIFHQEVSNQTEQIPFHDHPSFQNWAKKHE